MAGGGVRAREGRDELTEAEALQELEDQVRRYLDMTLDEFRQRAAEGSLPEHPAVAHLMLLSGVRSRTC